MKIHPALQDPKSVFVTRLPVPEAVSWDDYRQAAYKALSAMQLTLDGEKVVIKPNVTVGENIADPDSGIGTHPGFIHGMAEYLYHNGARRKRITVVEDPRNTDDNNPRHWRKSGYNKLADAADIRLHCPTSYTCVKKDIPEPSVFQRLNVSRLAVDPGTVLLNVPKLKTHNLGITTLCMKNLMGLVNVFDRHFCAQAWREIPETHNETRRREEWMDEIMHDRWQYGLAHRLADTAQVIQPHLNVVEGIIGREGTGFQNGRNRTLGLVVAGVNMVAVDAVASYLMGFDPSKLIYLLIAAEAGLGEFDLNQLKIYTPHEDQLIEAADLTAFRAAPPFRVITYLKGEDLHPFEAAVETR